MDFAQVPKFHADERRVKQVILNLLTNAAKYTENGGRIEIDAVANDGGFIEVRVKDTGIGMGADELARVITPFIQGGDPMVRLSEGSGLGLPLVQSIVDAHGGTLSIESNVGVGTTAIVTFPISG
jgi:signal transduction histidine kinase